MTESTPTLRRIAVYPIKSLDPMVQDEASIIPTGSLRYDREFAIFDADGTVVNGKRTTDVHRLRTTYEFADDCRRVTLRERETEDSATFDLLSNADGANAWLSDFFGIVTILRRRTDGGYPDLTEYPSGPTVISTGTIREVASWFPDITPDEVRLRFRANLEIDGVPPFWEDQLYTATDNEVRFRIGDAGFCGVQPCPRCVVPLRDPQTGETHDDFRDVFIQTRGETYPEWGNTNAFSHFFHLMVNTHVREREVGKTIAVGDEVTIRGEYEHSPAEHR